MATNAVHEAARTTLDEERSELQRRLNELEDALLRLANGTFGICEICHELISDEVLVATPAARLCEDCASAQRTILTIDIDVE